MGLFCKKTADENSELVKRLTSELKKNGLTNLSDNASRYELIEKGISHVNELGDKCKLAIEVLSSTETLEANKIVATETRNLAIATALMALFTLGLLTDAGIKNWREFQHERESDILTERAQKLDQAEKKLRLQQQAVASKEAELKAREAKISASEQAQKDVKKILPQQPKPHTESKQNPVPKHG